MAIKTKQSFGQILREAREKKFSLRKFAILNKVSPTYLSQVEQGRIAAPTADRVKRMAELLGANPDEWIALAGRVADDLPSIIHSEPTEVPELLRAIHGLTIEQIRSLREKAETMKRSTRTQGG